MQCFSHHGQDLWVFRALGESTTGFFIEMGAHDGVTISNSYALERLGWQGICIEPARDPFAQLRQSRTCICVNALVAGKGRTTATFVDSSGGSFEDSGLSGIADLRARQTAGESFEMQTRRMIDVLRQCRAPRRIDYFSLDVEGAEIEILEDFPFDDYEVALWTVEHNAVALPGRAPVASRICEILVQRGYRYVGDLCDDGLYCLPELYESATKALR